MALAIAAREPVRSTSGTTIETRREEAACLDAAQGREEGGHNQGSAYKDCQHNVHHRTQALQEIAQLQG